MNTDIINMTYAGLTLVGFNICAAVGWCCSDHLTSVITLGIAITRIFSCGLFGGI